MEICACPFLSDGKLTVVTCRELCVAVFLWNAMMFQRRPSQLWFVTFTTCQLMSKWSVRADIGSWCWSHSQSCPSHFAGSLLLEFRQEDAGAWALKEKWTWEFDYYVLPCGLVCFGLLLFSLLVWLVWFCFVFALFCLFCLPAARWCIFRVSEVSVKQITTGVGEHFRAYDFFSFLCDMVLVCGFKFYNKQTCWCD